MSLDPTKPTDQATVAELASYIRENRVAINAVSGSGNVGFTDLTVSVGTTSLAVGTDLGAYGLDVVKITGSGLSTIATITGGSAGQIKAFIFQDANIDITDGNAKAGGVFYLNQLPAGSAFDAQQDDVLVLVNIGGDGASIPGYWKELYRTISIK